MQDYTDEMNDNEVAEQFSGDPELLALLAELEI